MPQLNDFAEFVSDSLIREYLNLKGMQSTLACMDHECPRHFNSITSRRILVNKLHIEPLMKANKARQHPLLAILEVMTNFFLNSEELCLVNCLRDHYRLECKFPANESVDVEHHSNGRKQDKFLTPVSRPSTATMNLSKGHAEHEIIIDEEELISGEEISAFANEKTLGHVFSCVKCPSRSTSMLASNKICNIANHPDCSAMQTSKSFQSGIECSSHQAISPEYLKPFHNNTCEFAGVKKAFLLTSLQSMDEPLPLQRSVNSGNCHGRASSFQELIIAGEKKFSLSCNKLSETSNIPSKCEYNLDTSSITQENKKCVKPTTCVSVHDEDLVFTDVTEMYDKSEDIRLSAWCNYGREKTSRQLDSKSIDTHTAIALKTLVFGNAMKSYSDEWSMQSFTFCDLPDLRYGMVQRKGGTCGVLAAMQAVVVKEMLFGKMCLPLESRTSSDVHVLGSAKFRVDGITEKLIFYTFTNYDDLHNFVNNHISQFETDGCPGVVLCMYSSILSHGIERVKKDMDEVNGTLIGFHDYCTQELVSLLLTGEAVSNVFNGVMSLDTGTGEIMPLRGISARSDIGFLSLFEHYGSCEVGTYLKTPKYPVWVVCSESHFTVLFSTRLDLVSDWKAECQFDLYYYDGLARQQEQIKLTVLTTNDCQPPGEGDLVPPLEHCIRTKWAGAEINWNGYEPIL